MKDDSFFPKLIVFSIKIYITSMDLVYICSFIWRRRQSSLWNGVCLHVSLRLENTQGSLQSGMPGSTSETQGRFCDGLGNKSCFLLVLLLPFMAKLLQGSTWTGWVIRCISRSRRYFLPNNDAIFQDDNAPVNTAGTIQSWIEEHEDEPQHLPWQHSHQSWISLNHSAQFWRPEWGTDSHLQHL
jgi:hypothetical protein